MRHRASRPVLDPVRRGAALLAGRRGRYVVVPAFALAAAAGGGVTALDLAGDDRAVEAAKAGGTLNRAGAFAEASGSITTEPSAGSASASPSKHGTLAPAGGAEADSDRRTTPSDTAETAGTTAPSLPGSDVPSPSTSTAAPSTSSPMSPWNSDGPTPTSSSGTPSGGSSPSNGPSSPSPTGDTTPPETSIVSGPVDDLPAVFEFTANEAATFQCSLDGAGWQACGSGLTLSGLDAGWHTLSVRATDQAGNVDGSPAEWSWHTNGK